MTGMEAAGAAAARTAAKLAKGALADSQATSEKLLEVAKETPEFQEAGELVAKRVAVRQAVLLSLYRPLGLIFPRARKYFREDLPRDLAEKTAGIPDEDLIEPSPVLAAPALEGLAYSLDEPDLKEMYLNLLARASDGRSASKAHPSFPEIIKQLSPKEAEVLQWILKLPAEPLMRVTATAPGTTGGRVIHDHLVCWMDTDTGAPVSDPMIPTFIDNWVRLGLVEASYISRLTADDAYRWYYDHSEFMSLLEPGEEGEVRQFHHGVMRVTEFGRLFGEVVTTPPTAASKS